MIFIKFNLLKLYLQEITFYRKSPNDFTDHYVMKLTPILFIALSILGLVKFVFFTQISCATPLEWSTSWNDYANQICFVEGTYLQSYNESEQQVKGIGYYQWMPYYFLFITGFSSIPMIVWNITRSFFKIDLDHLLRLVGHLSKGHNNNNSTDVLQYTINLFNNMYVLRKPNVFIGKRLAIKSCFWDGKVMMLTYFSIKILCNVHFIVIIFMIQLMIEENHWWFGWELLINNAIDETYWERSGSFPRLAWCDIGSGIDLNIVLGKIQCVLAANSLYEKIVILIWFWLVLGLILMVCSWVRWMGFFVTTENCGYLQYHIDMGQFSDDVGSQNDRSVIYDQQANRKMLEFKNLYLGFDGLFILKLIEIQFGTIDMQHLLWKLWNNFNSFYDDYV